ncbi:hypothetical protein HRW16_19335 [Streptomyces lunaelactis]|uniref:hypothetical protein n=1 Tax=Streptomyces lunaelactis TaxID=1535768 RepID=UPI001584808C|nr:hypothetical protein [Streptomyces lunaelactis]NUK32518.1 hypothetical protein [Streptomyces lunaelactis]NUK93949.1 hypothetical protein [Streptomyces lunaelactis]NUL30193.1 hypothetical protein [Streptomyces lunaelactis]
MGELSAPNSLEQLYASWGEQPSIARPIMQGDIFEQVILPGLGDEPQTAQVVMHACNMRAGAKLRPRLTVIPVKSYSFAPAHWRKSVRIMPLPELHGNGSDSYKADFLEFTSVPSADLPLTSRVAALSNEGVLVFQQRLVYTTTRLLLRIETFHEQMAPIFTELELQEDWVEEALEAAGELTSTQSDHLATSAATDFQNWLDEDDKSRRSSLSDVIQHSRLRRESRAACEARTGDV